MAKERKQEQVQVPATETDIEPMGPPKSYRLHLMLGFVCLILFQMIVLSILLPPRDKVRRGGFGLDPVKGVGGFDKTNLVPPDIVKNEPMVEKQIGDKAFKVKIFKGEANETFSVVIHVQIRKADESKFNKRYEACMNDINDRITSVLYASNDNERREVGFTAIKEKIKRAINDVLGTPWVQAVFCTEPAFESL